MKIAEIVPLKFLELTAKNDYHMCLAHLVLQSPEYRDFYRRMSDEGKYVIVDNGAAEDQVLDYDDLITVYNMINPTEIILPDVLFDRDQTINRTMEFITNYDLSGYKKMIVPQGADEGEWYECYKKMANIPELKNVNTIGIPKWLSKTDHAARLRICSVLRIGVEIHLLGCNEHPEDIKWCGLVNPSVRGCDSAFAYLCAKSGMPLISAHTDRPDCKIDFLNDTYGDNLAKLMNDFETIVGGTK